MTCYSNFSLIDALKSGSRTNDIMTITTLSSSVHKKYTQQSNCLMAVSNGDKIQMPMSVCLAFSNNRSYRSYISYFFIISYYLSVTIASVSPSWHHLQTFYLLLRSLNTPFPEGTYASNTIRLDFSITSAEN